MNYKITKEYPKEKTLGVGQVCLGKDGMCLMLDENGVNVVVIMQRAKVEEIFANGLRISGFEFIQGNNYRYQVWYCIYEEKQ